VISELQQQIEFETMWADPSRRAAFDHLRRAAGLVVSGLKSVGICRGFRTVVDSLASGLPGRLAANARL
jgi:hypothetical protein